MCGAKRSQEIQHCSLNTIKMDGGGLWVFVGLFAFSGTADIIGGITERVLWATRARLVVWP